SLRYTNSTCPQSWTQIEAFIHSRLKGRDSSALSPEPAPSGVYKFTSATRIYPWKEKLSKKYQTKVTLYTPTLLCLVPAQGTEVTYVTETFLVAVHCDITVWHPIHSRVIIQWQPITHTSLLKPLPS